MIEVCEGEGRFEGPELSLTSSSDYDAIFMKYLKTVQEETDLLPDDQVVDVLYSMFRSPRKTATMRIERAGFGNQFVDQMNIWRPQEKAQRRAARCKMNAHYADALHLMRTTWLGLYIL